MGRPVRKVVLRIDEPIAGSDALANPTSRRANRSFLSRVHLNRRRQNAMSKSEVDIV